MQHSPDSRPDSTPSAASSARTPSARASAVAQTFPEAAEPLQAGFLATLFRDLGAETPDGPSEEDTVAVHARAAALTHHRTLTVQAEHEHLADLLRRAALPVSAMDFESQLRRYEPRPFPADADLPPVEAEPRWADYAPPQPRPPTPTNRPPVGCSTPATSANSPRPGCATSATCASGGPVRPRAPRPSPGPHGPPTRRPSRRRPGLCASTTRAWRSADGRTGCPNRPRWSPCWSAPSPPPRSPPAISRPPAGPCSAR
ncbi:hypothetical protein ACFQ1I_16985 [Kitasatospora arboriphila]